MEVLNSISRVAVDVVDPEHHKAAAQVRRVLATWNDIEDLVSIGAYVSGANADYDVAVQTRDAVNTFLRQDRSTGGSFEEASAALKQLGRQITAVAQQLQNSRGAAAAAPKRG